ncbi:SET and MYND domain-containing protein 4-like isoform X3 [Leptidea sinapis]|uniref:SET and MYND domain-containing protein 4-like isoform X3 n=1 Tax=Leptidea sinapis TaxID=189913 RepID=UPI0021C2D430|nr:SET and MYND domain-containing protein 4-like isoform X3 [Leptidea sinapis]
MSNRMSNGSQVDECAKNWFMLLDLLITREEKNIVRTNEIETLNYFYKNEMVKEILVTWLKEMKSSYAKRMNDSDTALKCNNIALFWRKRGNEKYAKNLIEESYDCYCKSVVFAQQNDTEYATALANRSASLMRLKRFQECLADIELSLKNGYKVELQPKLLLRRVECYIELKQQHKAKDSLVIASKHARLVMSEEQWATFERRMKVLESKLQSIEHSTVKTETELPRCYGGDNEDFVNASNAVELRCSHCSRSVYCSEVCRSDGYNMFHKWECVGGQCGIFATIGIGHLALRVLLISAYNGFPAISDELPKVLTAADLFKRYSEVDDMAIYKRDHLDFYRMFNLVTNFDKMSNNDYMHYALTATMLTLYLEKFTVFFDEVPSKLPCVLSSTQLHLFSAAIVLRSMGQLICNAHSNVVSETIKDHSGQTLREEEVHRSTAIYPSAAMMNHSCDPNIQNTYYKNRLVVRSSRDIPAGAEVYNCYGPHFARQPTNTRRAELQAQYLFTCNCSACICDETTTIN